MPGEKQLISGKPLTRIAIADKPPALGGKISYHTPEEVSKLLGFEYTEALSGDPQLLKEPLENKLLHQAINAKPDQPKVPNVLQRLQNPLDCFVICKMFSSSEETDIGYGLFTLKDIPPGTVLFLYTGVVGSPKPNQKGGKYDIPWATLNNKTTPEKIVSADVKGNLSRFMQHLPI